MERATFAGRVRRLLGGVLPVAAILGGSAVLLACGQPRGTATSAGAAVPVPAGAAPTVSPIPLRPTLALNSTVAGVPSLPLGVPTKMRTPAVTSNAPTAVPDPGPLEKPTPDPRRPEPTYTQPRPEDPLRLTIYGAYSPNTKSSTRLSTTIAIGTVRQVLPARWTTPDGRRPANPHATTGGGTIYTPVLVEVEQWLKGGQPQCQLLVYALGGTVGQDWIVLSDGSATFQEGERVVLFLSGRIGEPLTNSGRPLWDIYERYTVIENMATNSYRTLPLQQLLDEIAEAQKQP